MDINEIYVLEKAIKQSPSSPELYYQLGIECFKQQLFAKAKDSWEKAIELKPEYTDAIASLGFYYIKEKEYAFARKVLTKGLQSQPTHITCLINLALAFQMDVFFDESAEIYQKIINLDPANQKAMFGYAQILYKTGNYEKAIILLQQLINIYPNLKQAKYLLGCAYQDNRHYKEAIQCFKSIIRNHPDFSPAYYNVGKIYQMSGQLSKAEVFLQKAIQVKNNFAEAYASLGGLYLDMADIDHAQTVFIKSLTFKDDLKIISVYLYFLNFFPDIQTEQKKICHHEWGKRLSARLSTYSHDQHDYHPNRQLKIAYVSPDFCKHSVFYFFFPILMNHNTDQFIIYLYSNVQKEDHLTDKIKSFCHSFRNIRGLSAESVSRLIQNDRIDILIDLAGHTYNHRLDIFAMKPAPLQLTYIGYPYTTGLAEMDYRLTDLESDPEDNAEYTEKLIRLDAPFLCYYPPETLPEISALPFIENKYITFGSFNYLGKINKNVITVWAELLKNIPDSVLILKSRPLRDRFVQQKIHQLFNQKGVDQNRVQLKAYNQSMYEHLSQYKQIDIALDPFPYNGTTTTCEALIMGVPVFTIEGSNHSGRVTTSLLKAVGLHDFITKNKTDLLYKVDVLLKDKNLLLYLRSHLRGLMLKSKLCDGRQHTKKIETVFSKIWQKKCNTQKKIQYFC